MTVEFELDEDYIDELFTSIERANGLVVYQAPYALYVETNTSYDRGLKPPFQPLFEWAQRNVTSDRDEAENVAWALQEKIYQQGIEGEFFLITTKAEWGNKWKDVAREFKGGDPKAPEKIVEAILEGILEDSNSKIREADKVDTGNLIDSGIVLMGVDPEERNVMEMQANVAIRSNN